MCFCRAEATQIQLTKDIEKGSSRDLFAVAKRLQFASRADYKRDWVVVGQTAQETEKLDVKIPVQSNGLELVQQQDQLHASAGQSGHQLTYILIGRATFGDHRILTGQGDLLEEGTKELGSVAMHVFL